jgi:hypothetical protein
VNRNVWTVRALFLAAFLLWPVVALADNCSGLFDCWSSACAAGAAAAGAGAAAGGGMGGGDDPDGSGDDPEDPRGDDDGDC